MSNHADIKLMTPLTKVFIGIFGFGCILIIYRLLFGLRAVTNLNDYWPWGLWITIDVLGGVAMAAGGFLIAATVYILNWKKYKAIVRPAILNAFFGYALAATSITLDLGRPFVIWHPLVMWQINSIMFIVAIHVVLYTTTLATESSPMVFEKFGMNKALKTVKKIMVPIVIFGVLLSVLHQSSLGAVFLITPSKLSPLWYSNYLPTWFLFSAVLMGLNMVSFETILSSRVFKHGVPKEVLFGLARGSLIVSCIYLAVKVIDLVRLGAVGLAFNGNFTSNMYLLEMVVGVILPIVLLLRKSVRTNIDRIFEVNIIVIMGVMLNRLNVGMFGMSEIASRTGADYFPSFSEFMVTAAMVSVAVVGFKICAKYLNLFPETEH
jgi:Ni/Fe-hydrogenase subunit HybB-like protein